MNTKFKFSLRAACQSFGVVCTVAVFLQFGVLAGYAQTGQYLFTGSETTITLNPGLYYITAYGAQGGTGGGLGAEMEAQLHPHASPAPVPLRADSRRLARHQSSDDSRRARGVAYAGRSHRRTRTERRV